MHQKVAVLLADIGREQAAAERQAAQAERDQKLLNELESIRGRRSEHWNEKQTDAEYSAAFRGFGIDVDQLDLKEAGLRVARRSQPVELASYLDDWALVRRRALKKEEAESWRGPLVVAQAADPDPWRAALRDLIGRHDQTALRQLANDEKILEAQTASSLALFRRRGRGRREIGTRRAGVATGVAASSGRLLGQYRPRKCVPAGECIVSAGRSRPLLFGRRGDSPVQLRGPR